MRKIKLKTHINVKRSFEHCTLNKYPIIEEALSPRIEHYTRMCLSPVIVKPVNIRVGGYCSLEYQPASDVYIRITKYILLFMDRLMEGKSFISYLDASKKTKMRT